RPLAGNENWRGALWRWCFYLLAYPRCYDHSLRGIAGNVIDTYGPVTIEGRRLCLRCYAIRGDQECDFALHAFGVVCRHTIIPGPGAWGNHGCSDAYWQYHHYRQYL